MRIKCPENGEVTPEECIKCGKCFPEPILKSLLAGRDYKRTHRKRPRFGVTYLISNCLRKSYYQLTEEVPIELEKLWIFSRGHAIHNFFQKDLPKESIEIFVKKNYSVFDVIGYVDAIYNNVLYEFKTINTVPQIPQDAHILQAQAYFSLLPEEKKEKIKKIKIIYFSLSSIRVFDVPKRDISPLLEAKGTILAQALKLGKPPRKQKNYLCDYCEFKELCIGEKEPSFDPSKIIYED